MKTLNGIAIATLLLMSVFAGALALDKVYQQPVSILDSNGNALTADTITVKTAAGSTVGTVSDKQSYTFLLNAGEYTVSAAKASYTVASAQIKIESASPTVMPKLTLKLTNLAPPALTGGTGTTGGTIGTQSSDVIVKDVVFDEKANPGQAVDFKVKLENKATYDAKDATLTVTLKAIDSGDDVKELVDIGTVDAGARQDSTVTVTVPNKVNAGKYNVEVKVEWTANDNSYVNTATAASQLEVVKDAHSVTINAMSLASATVQAGKSGQASVTLFNAGKNDETVRVKVESPDLKISTESAQFKLNEGDETTQYVPFNVPADAQAGKYLVYVTVYFNSGTQSNLQTATVEVISATASSQGAQVDITPIVVTTGTATASPGMGSFGTVGLVIAAIILLAVIGMLAKEFAPEFTAKPQIIKAGKR